MWGRSKTKRVNVGFDSLQICVCKIITFVKTRHVNPEVASSNPALVHFSLFIQMYLKMYPVSFLCGSLHDIYRKNVVSPYGASPYCLFPGCIVTWAWSLAKRQYMVSWLLTGAPEQRYWQNRETANIGLVCSVGRAAARQSRCRRFKSRSSKFSFIHPKCI